MARTSRAAAPAPPAPPGGGGGGGDVFSLTRYGNLLNLSTDRDTKLMQKAIEPFTTTFDGDVKNIDSFTDKIKERAKYIKYMHIFDIQTPLGTCLSLFDAITIEEVRAAAAPRWRENMWTKQASFIMGKVLLDSLSEEFRSKLILNEQDYQIESEGEKQNDGGLMMKAIFDTVFIEVDGEALNIRESLNEMRIQDNGNNVFTTHKAVQTLIKQMKSTRDSISETNEKMYLM